MLDNDLRRCIKCSNSLTIGQAVPGEGPVAPGGIMLVGEAPGSEEAAIGKPFVGGAGRILNKIIYGAGLERSQFYITNLVKCRPPNNRTPSSVEVGNCLSHLQQELKIVKPRLVVALGREAALMLSGKDLSYRGLTVPSILNPAIPVLITYHPAHHMYKGFRDFNTSVWDLEKITYPIKDYPENYLINPDITIARQKIREWMSVPNNIITSDIETAGEGKDAALDPFRGSVIGISFCGKEGDAFSLNLGPSTIAAWEFVRSVMEDKNIPLCWQHGMFDRYFLLRRSNINVTNVQWDTMDAHYATWSDSPLRGLDYLRSLHTNKPAYKAVYQSSGNAWKQDHDLGIYACRDSDVTYQVMKRQQKLMDESQKKTLARVLMFDTVAVKMKNRGVNVDKRKIAVNHLSKSPEIIKLDGWFLRNYGVNPASPKQMAELIYDVKKIPVPSRAWTKSGGRSVGEKFHDQLKRNALSKEEHEIIDNLALYRKKAKEHATYIEGMFKRINPKTNRIHADWKPTGTDTGRPACKNPNLLNVPKDLRDQFIPTEGNVFFVGDYIQLELLTGGILSGEDKLVTAIVQGRDIHHEVRQELEKHITCSRVMAKQGVFGTMYGITPDALANNLKIPLATAKFIQDFLRNEFPKLSIFGDNNIKEWRELGFLETPFGRRKFCETSLQALNFKTQSGGFDVALNSMVQLEKAGYSIVINVYDQNVCDEPVTDDMQGRFEEFIHIMEHAAPDLCERFPIDAAIQTTWKEGDVYNGTEK